MLDLGSRGVVFLGGAIDTPDYCRAHVEACLDEGLKQMEAALSMPVCQERLRVVIGSIGLNPSYLARIMPLEDYGDLVERWDDGLRAVPVGDSECAHL